MYVLPHVSSQNNVTSPEARKKINISSVVYVGMGLDVHQISYQQILQVKGCVAFRWVVLCCHQSDYLSDKKDSKTI